MSLLLDKMRCPAGDSTSTSAMDTAIAGVCEQLTSSQVATQEADKGVVDCQLEITHAKPLLMAAFREVNGPCVEKILRLQDLCMKFNALS